MRVLIATDGSDYSKAAIAESCRFASLSAGRQAIGSIPNVEILQEFEWDEASTTWVFHVRLSPSNLIFNEYVPSETEWYVSVDAQYPFGDINFFPSKDKLKPFGIRQPDRRAHMYLLGKTGTGKSTLLETLVLDDIRKGKGCALLDPHDRGSSE